MVVVVVVVVVVKHEEEEFEEGRVTFMLLNNIISVFIWGFLLVDHSAVLKTEELRSNGDDVDFKSRATKEIQMRFV